MEDLLIILLATICTGAPFWIGQRYGCVARVSPMHLLAYFCALGFLLKASVYSVAPQLAFYRGFVQTPWADLRGALYLGVFILLICLGYVAVARPVSRTHAQAAARAIAIGITRQGWLFAGAFAFSMMTFAFVLRARGLGLFDPQLLAGLNATKQVNINHSGVGATMAGIKTFFIIPKFAFVVLLANGITLRSRAVMMQAALIGVLLIAIALVSGDRFELIELLVFAVATHALVGGRVTARMVVLGAILLGLALAVSAYMTQLRFHGAQMSILHQIVGSTYFLDFNVAVMVTDRVSAGQFLYGESYTWWVFGWIPRAIWFDKPAIDLGVYFKRDVMQIYTGGAYNVTGPGEAFINFGWYGLGVGAVLGALYRRLEEALVHSVHVLRYGAVLLYPVLLYPFVQATLQSSFSAYIVGAAAQLVLIVAMIGLCVTRFGETANSSRRLRYAG